MKISSIVDIVQGLLQNDPSISFITQQHTNLSKIKDGDLFISSNPEEIKLAVQQGAFSVIYDIELDISVLDTEIAWIKVDSIDKSIIQLLRFTLSQKDIDTFYMNKVEYNILQSIINQNNDILILQNSLKENFELLNNNTLYKTLISDNLPLLKQIDPTYTYIEQLQHNITNLTIHSLFKTSFSWQKQYFAYLHLSYLYVEQFLNIINFCQQHKIKYDINKTTNLSYMKPIFIDKQNHIIDFGKSCRFILTNNQTTLIDNEIKFITKYYKYGKITILDGNCFDEILLDQIINADFNLLYIKNRSLNDIVKLLNTNITITNQLF